MKIYTVGHSNRSLEELINILKKYNIKLLIDIRRFPKSNKYPHFNKENLEIEFGKSNISYIWMGESLGGYRKGGYQEYTKTDKFINATEKLIEFATKNIFRDKTAIMCTEKLWFKCHRRFIVKKLCEIGHKVFHIYDEDRLNEHKFIIE